MPVIAEAKSYAEAVTPTPTFSWAKTLIDHGASWPKCISSRYYNGDIETLEKDGRFDLVFHPGPASPYPVTLVTSQCRYVFNRSWAHIRANNEDFVELKYVEQGSFSITRMGQKHIVNPGQFVLIRPKVPYRWECLSVYRTPTRMLLIHFPPDIVHSHLPEGIPLNACLSAPSNKKLLMPSLLNLLYEQGIHLDVSITNQLAAVILSEVRLIAKQNGIAGDPRKNICDRRVDDIIDYMRLHLSNPDISLSSVAQGCGISPRYLSYLLRVKGTTFSNLLWEERLKRAHAWLETLDSGRHSISEIAYMSGFKTAAHFSRLFRGHYGCSPRELRARKGE